MQPQTLLTSCIEQFRSARKAIADALEALYAVHESGAWSQRYSSWTEFCEDGLQISHSTASQYIQVYDHYINHGRLTVNDVRQVDIQKLYLAMRADGTPKEQYSKALTLSRRELKEERTEADGHQHVWVTACATCHIRHED